MFSCVLSSRSQPGCRQLVTAFLKLPAKFDDLLDGVWRAQRLEAVRVRREQASPITAGRSSTE